MTINHNKKYNNLKNCLAPYQLYTKSKNYLSLVYYKSKFKKSKYMSSVDLQILLYVVV